MKRLIFPCVLVLSMTSWLAAQTVVDFEELTLFTGESPAGGGSFYNGNDGSGTTNNAGWSSNGVLFSNSYNDSLPAFDFWSGWAYSNVANATTPGFNNQYASITGGGANGLDGVAVGENYAVAYQSESYFNIPELQSLESVEVTNTTYSALSMLNGDSFAKKFGGESGSDPDLFQVTFTGYDAIGATGQELASVSVSLADFRFADNSQDFILNDWLTVDLSSLANARSVGLRFDSTDVGDFGINTPTYVAMDNFRLSLVPEPSGFGISVVLITMAILGRHRRDRILRC